jgi:uncharacterized repeat protein (TIGR01451 family)
VAAEPITRQVVIKQGAAVQRFTPAQDVVLLKTKGGADKYVRVVPQTTIEGLSAQAAAIKTKAGDDVFMVLLDAQDPHNDSKRKVLSKTIVLELAPEVDDKALAAEVGAVSKGRMPFAPKFCVFETTALDGALKVSAALQGKAGVISAEPELAVTTVRLFTPNDTLFPQQWHLRNTGQNGAVAGIDANVTSVWDIYRGAGVKILVVDDSLEEAHPDLALNVDVSIGWDYRDNDGDPGPADPADSHGTAVAGITAARGNNALGVAGAAFEATISGVRLIGSALPLSTLAQALSHSNSVVDISNNSWGFTSPGFQIPPIMEAALADSVNGRNGKGKIFVFAAGNGGPFDDVNMTTIANSIFTIAVAALNDQGTRASYSTPGAALVIAAPSGRDAISAQGSTTTDVTGAAGYNDGATAGEVADADYTQNFNGTSSATPLVSGVIALMLQANPNLGWRDVQEILIRSAKKINPTDAGWTVNGAGYHFHHEYGAGMVDALAAVTMARTWTNLRMQVVETAALSNLSVVIPDNDSVGVSVQFSITNATLRAEHVKLNLDALHTFRGDLEIYLTSPSGTTSRLVQSGVAGPVRDYADYPFMTTHNWGESAAGVWTLRIADLEGGDVGTLTGARLTIYGTTSVAGFVLNVLDATPVTEGNATTNVNFEVQLALPTTDQVTVNYLVANGRAKSGEDFTANSGVLTFAPGVTNKTLTVNIVGDLIDEPEEGFSLVIYSPTNGVVGRAQGFASIIDDDPQTAQMSVLDATVTEGDSGTKDVTVTVQLSAPSGHVVTANYNTVPGTAAVGFDYLPASGTLAFEPGTTTKSLVLKLVGDQVREAAEIFYFNISGASFATIADNQGAITIQDNDPVPTVSVADVSVVEGDAGTTAMVFNLSLSNPTALPVTVDYSTADGSATVAGADYVAGSGQVTFSPGQLSATVTVNVTADLVEEPNETLVLNLATPVNAGSGDMSATGTVLNDDGPNLSIAGVSILEGPASTTTDAIFTVTLAKPNASTVTVDYSVQAGSATANTDYQPLTGQLSFPSGVTSQEIIITVIGDADLETNETFTVTLANPVNATIATATAQGVIVDDDAIANLAVTAAVPGTNVYVGYPFVLTLTVDNLGPYAATNVVVEHVLPAGFSLVSSNLVGASGTITETGGTVRATVQTLANAGQFSVQLLVNASAAGEPEFEATVSSNQYDDNDANNTITITKSVIAPVVSVAAAGSLLVQEGFQPPNRGLDPGETVTMSFKLRNTGNIASTNVVGILRSTGGITAVTAANKFGIIPVDSVSNQEFVFIVEGASGDPLTATLDVYDVTPAGSNSLGSVTYVYQTSEKVTLTSATPIAIPAFGEAAIYPSTFTVAGLVGRVSKVTVTLNGITHGFPDDLDVLLVAPDGRGVILMSDVGGTLDLAGVNLTFDDSASTSLPDSSKINSGTYKPTNFVGGDAFSSAPAGPYGAELASFIGLVPNGEWKLFIMDDGAGDAGSISGWSLSIQTTIPADPVAELAVSGTVDPNPVFVGQNFTYYVTVQNQGPAAASNVALTSILPPGVTILSSTPVVSSSAGSEHLFNLGSLASGASTVVSIAVVSSEPGSLTNLVSVVADEIDLQVQNSSAALVTRVNRVTMLSTASTPVPAGQFALNLAGQAGLTYVIEVSNDLVTWTPVFTNTTLDGAVSFTDTNAAGVGLRFYRAVER